MNDITRNSYNLNKAYVALKNHFSTAKDEKTGEVSTKWNNLKAKHFDCESDFYTYQGYCLAAVNATSLDDFMVMCNKALDMVKALLPDDLNACIDYFNKRICDKIFRTTATLKRDKEEDGKATVKARNASYIATSVIEQYVYSILNDLDCFDFIENTKDRDRIAQRKRDALEKQRKAENKANAAVDTAVASVASVA